MFVFFDCLGPIQFSISIKKKRTELRELWASCKLHCTTRTRNVSMLGFYTVLLHSIHRCEKSAE